MKVLIAVDDSKCSDVAVEKVSCRPWRGDTEFLVLTVVPPSPVEYARLRRADANSYERRHEAKRRMSRLTVDRHVLFLQNKLPGNSVTGKVLEGDIRELIAQEARQWEADFVIMGTHGRTGFARFLWGSVSEYVATRVPCSVEILKNGQSGSQVQPSSA